MEEKLRKRYEKLKEYLAGFGSLALAFSGGVDSTFLLYAAKEALGNQLVAVTVSALTFPERELGEAEAFCRKNGIRQRLVTLDQLKIEGFAGNPVNRCYLCKRSLFGEILRKAEEEGIPTVAEGTNADDLGDYRPGLQAIRELGIKSPLLELGFTKREIRELSAYLNLPTAGKPSYACLATRFPYGDAITEEKLARVDRAEQLLINLGFGQLRVRCHGDLARIELDPADLDRFMQEELRAEVYRKFREYGFTYVSLDLAGYRTGSMNAGLD